MQIFGNEGKEEAPPVLVGGQKVKVKKASSLEEGTHPARFYPLSALFHEGADYISIVHHLHWLRKRPCICRRTSYDYSVPETANKPRIDTSCIICNDKFAWFKKALAIKESDPQESKRLKEIGRGLMEKVSASSIVSFLDGNGNLTFPVILRYGKELLEQLQLNALRILESSKVHLCDPAQGYMSDIIIGKNDGGFRTYKNSMPSVDMKPVDITTAPWKWKEIAMAIKSEIKPIPTPDEVRTFYLANYGKQDEQTFVYPAFTHQQVGGSERVAVAEENLTNERGSTPPNNNQLSMTFAPPPPPAISDNSPLNSDGHSNGELASPKHSCVPAPAIKENTKLYPCNAQSDKGSGYDKNDAGCKACSQAEGCYKHSVPSVLENTVADNAAPFDPNSIQKKLDLLSKKMTEDK